MSYTSIDTCVKDAEFQARVKSAASKEAWVGGPEFSESVYGERLRTYPDEALTTFMYAAAIDSEAAYEFALNSSNPSPGGDPAVITDANIQSCVQAHWPKDPAAVPLPTDMVGPTPGNP
jgi:hypothetical protein